MEAEKQQPDEHQQEENARAMVVELEWADAQQKKATLSLREEDVETDFEHNILQQKSREQENSKRKPEEERQEQEEDA